MMCEPPANLKIGRGRFGDRKQAETLLSSSYALNYLLFLLLLLLREGLAI